MENKQSSGSIGSGFLLGLLLGVLLTLLVTTKKGREILRELMDKVIQKLSSMDESLEKLREEQKPEDENDYIKPDPTDIKKEIRYLAAESVKEHTIQKKQAEVNSDVNIINEKGGKQEKPSRRLFFRRPKKSN